MAPLDPPIHRRRNTFFILGGTIYFRHYYLRVGGGVAIYACAGSARDNYARIAHAAKIVCKPRSTLGGAAERTIKY